MSNSSLFEKPLLKDPDEEVISSLGAVYGEGVLKREQDLEKDATPLQMEASVVALQIPGCPVDHRQPAENLYVSYHETHT